MTHRTYSLTPEAFEAHEQLGALGRNRSEIIQEALIAAASGRSHHEAAVVAVLDRQIATRESELEDLRAERARMNNVLHEKRLTSELLAEDRAAAERRLALNQLREWLKTTGGGVTTAWPATRITALKFQAFGEAEGVDDRFGDWIEEEIR